MNHINNCILIEINLNSYQSLKHKYNNSYTEYGSFGRAVAVHAVKSFCNKNVLRKVEILN